MSRRIPSALWRRSVTATFVTGALWLAAGCGGADARPTCRAPQLSELVVRAGERVNLDPSGRSLPTVVRVYQLRSVAALDNASFEDVWRNAEEALGDELLDSTELTVFPESETRRPVEASPDARYVVGVAIFREPAGRSWSSTFVLPVDPPGCTPPEEGPPTARVLVSLDGSRVTARGQVLGQEGPQGDEPGLPDLPEDDAVAGAPPTTDPS